MKDTVAFGNGRTLENSVEALILKIQHDTRRLHDLIMETRDQCANTHLLYSVSALKIVSG